MRYQSFTSSQKNFVVCADTRRSMSAFNKADDLLPVQDVPLTHAFGPFGAVACNQLELITLVPDQLIFDRLKSNWYLEREGVSSSINDAAMCPAYQQIIGMGERAVPFILRSIESEGDEPDMWFWALRFITGVDPLLESERGDINAMARRWLGWAVGKYAW